MSFESTGADSYFVFLISMSKRSADKDSLPQGKHRLTGFNPEWVKDFPFVLYNEDASGAGGMFCSLCQKWDKVTANKTKVDIVMLYK